MALSFYAGCVRVKNDKLKTALGVTLRYPTYREGLRALFDGRLRSAAIRSAYSPVMPASRIICAQASIDSFRNAGASASGKRIRLVAERAHALARRPASPPPH